jgi:hypothetical protein
VTQFRLYRPLNKEGKNWYSYGLLIEDARVMLNSSQLWSVNHLRREANEVAHRLVNETLSLMDEQVHMEEGLFVFFTL